MFQHEIEDGLHSITTATVDGTFQLKATFNASAIHTSDFKLDPNQVNLETIVNDFPYAEQGTQLCLMADMQTNAEQVQSKIDGLIAEVCHRPSLPLCLPLPHTPAGAHAPDTACTHRIRLQGLHVIHNRGSDRSPERGSGQGSGSGSGSGRQGHPPSFESAS